MTTTQTATTWDRDTIAAQIETSYKVLTRGLLAIYRCQTADEQGSKDTRVANGRGFNQYDARFGSSLAEQLLNGSNLTERQIVAARRLMRKYVGQLAAIAAETAAAKATATKTDARRAASEAAQRAEQIGGYGYDHDGYDGEGEDDAEAAEAAQCYEGHHAN